MNFLLFLLDLYFCLFFREKITSIQSKALEQASGHQTKEASLRDRLESAQTQLSDAVRVREGEWCTFVLRGTHPIEAWRSCHRQELELKLKKMERDNAIKEVKLRDNVKHLTRENDRLSHLSAERMQIMQVRGADCFHASQ